VACGIDPERLHRGEPESGRTVEDATPGIEAARRLGEQSDLSKRASAGAAGSVSVRQRRQWASEITGSIVRGSASTMNLTRFERRTADTTGTVPSTGAAPFVASQCRRA